MLSTKGRMCQRRFFSNIFKPNFKNRKKLSFHHKFKFLIPITLQLDGVHFFFNSSEEEVVLQKKILLFKFYEDKQRKVVSFHK